MNKTNSPLNSGGVNNNNNTGNAIHIPQINLPKGGGALKGIDEKFSVNAANGTASFSIPLPLTPSRNNFSPSLALAYNSGAGSSVFGLGWNIDIPSIFRKTNKAIPKYRDDDVFVFSGGEDLVPYYKEDGTQEIKFLTDFTVTRYRPRIESSFDRIEKVKPKNAETFYWKVTTKENIVTIFGRTSSYQITNPQDENKVFRWLPEISFDDKGNVIVFEYKKEDGVIGNVQLHDKNRFDNTHHPLFTNQYLKRIKYGNQTPFYPAYVNTPADENSIYNPAVPVNLPFFFEALFDYGEHGNIPIPVDGSITVTYNEAGSWSTRTDAFSDYKSGFEIRTYRLCRRVLMYHHFDELGDAPYLVKSLQLNYASTLPNAVQPTEVTYLASTIQSGYTRTNAADSYTRSSLPPVDFEYAALNWNTEIKEISKESIVNAPVGLGSNYQWVDLYSEGVSGILTEQSEAWYYKSNKGNCEFTDAQPVVPKPSFLGLSNGLLSIQDLNADGRKQVVSHEANFSGYYELTDDNDWLPFETFNGVPNINYAETKAQFIDLSGDGKADLLLTEDSAFCWYASLGKAGYDVVEQSRKFSDEEQGPTLVTLDEEQTIFFADMSGDGLTDIVRIKNGEVCYWPNIGYGRFGKKVTMSNSPLFDNPESFNASYLHLADISGTGATDIIYLGKNKFSAWWNLSGNSWSAMPNEIKPFVSTEQPNQLSVIDLLGTGTACIVWSSSLPSNSNAPMKYIDLMGGRKPHVMTSYKNNMGKETVVEYKSSTHYYLEDGKADKPWITKLPFAVQCVNKLEVIDTVTDLRFTKLYKYHHGYFDHEEGEFRGFGMVEQTDTEEYEYLKNKNAANATDILFHEPPILTKTWNHTGAYLRNKKILEHYKHEYWYNDSFIKTNFGDLATQEPELPEALFSGELSNAELVEAHRACKGMILREEVFSLDGTEHEKIPYSVATHNCFVKLLQPKKNNPNPVFIVHESEAITFSYERNATDPRIAHTLNLAIDDLGNVLKGASVVYPRRQRPAELTEDKVWDEQNKRHIMFSEASFTDDKITSSAYRLRLPYQSLTYEVQVKKSLGSNQLFLLDDLNIALEEIPYEVTFTPSANQKRCIEHSKNIFLNNDLTTAMPEGHHDTLGFRHEAYQLAFTANLLDKIYKRDGEASKVNTAMLTEAKYINLNGDGSWWIRSGTIQYFNAGVGESAANAAQRFYLPLAYTDAFGATTSVNYYNNYHLLIQQTKDALDNVVTAEEFDFRILTPKRIKDINGNITEVAVNSLGLVTGVAVKGKGNEADNLDGFLTDLTPQQLTDFFNDPSTNGSSLLQHATSRMVYNFSAYPCCVASIVREEHFANNPASKLQFGFEYSDGMGNVTLKKIQAEPGKAPHRGIDGKLVKLPTGDLDLVDTTNRWVGNGRTILNNKGKVIKSYEPYFANSPQFEVEPELREAGVTSIMHYDAVGRLVKTIMPDDTLSRSTYDAWMQKTYDANDTIKESKWYNDRFNRLIDAALTQEGKDPEKEKDAAEKASLHDNTPSVIHNDSLGRAFYSIVHNKFKDAPTATIKEEFYATQSVIDIEGNVQSAIDARGNTVMAYKYDILGRQVYQSSMDGGERWMLNDYLGKPVFGWDSKQQQFETTYDELHRPLTVTVTKDGTSTVLERFEYADSKGLSAADLLSKQQLNFIGKAIVHYDSSGVTKLLKCDFKGNTIDSSRQLYQDYKTIPDWINPAVVVMDTEVFISNNEFDALNRATKVFTPHTPDIPASVIMPEYNEANLLKAVKAKLRGSAATSTFVTNIEYDAKGQRLSIQYGNATLTTYRYDKKSLRLLRLRTTRNAGAEVLQDLNYTFDPVGNISFIRDDAQQTIFFNNQQVEPHNDYVYDAIYRLIEAAGREHVGNNTAPGAYDEQRTNLSHKGDGNLIQQYKQRYTYDAVGNILTMQQVNGWSRTFTYNNTNNYLLTAQANTDAGTPFTYTYDEHGNMKALPHLPLMEWNSKDQLQHVGITASANNDLSQNAYYVYDGSGQRVRKVVEKNNVTEERIYFGGFEIFRKKRNNVLELERETLHIMDDTRRVAMIDTPTVKPAGNNETVLTRYQYSNHLSTASLELDDAAAIINYEEYYPFGSTSYQASDKLREVAAKRYRYTGKERDEESGLNYHSARYYAPWLARWTAVDPIGIGDGLNVYAYVHNNPVAFADPSGTSSGDDEKPSQVLDFLSNFGIRTDSSRESSGPGFFESLGNTISSIGNSIISGLRSVGEWIAGAARTVWNAIKSAASSAWEWIKGAAGTAWNWIKDAASSVWNWAKGAATTAWNAIKSAASTAWNWIKGAARTAWEWTKGAASTAWSWIRRAASAVWNWALAPLVRTAVNTAVGAGIGFLIGGPVGAVIGGGIGAVSGGIQGWAMASAHSYNWSSFTGWASFVLDNTWSAPNSFIGSLWASFNIFRSPIDAQSRNSNALVFSNGVIPGYATTLGNVIAGTNPLHHELSHVLQARIFGPLFYPSMLVHYGINTIIPYWLAYHNKQYPNKPITSIGEYFTRGVYPHTWAEEWGYSIEGEPQ
jgi:RHS repeat-associated protein